MQKENQMWILDDKITVTPNGTQDVMSHVCVQAKLGAMTYAHHKSKVLLDVLGGTDTLLMLASAICYHLGKREKREREREVRREKRCL